MAWRSAGFSRLSDADLDDEDDERLRLVETARVLYAKAEQVHQSRGSNEDVLRLFEEAEAALGWVIQCGLSGLRQPELEPVLKGRLHQAVILAALEQRGDTRWVKVRSLAEEVLQFDFENCHARWLRGVALHHGADPRRRSEARDEMQRAMSCARSQGRTQEANQWEAESQRLEEIRAAASTPAPAAPSQEEARAVAASLQAGSEGSTSVPAMPAENAPPAPSEPSFSSSSASALRRGFFENTKQTQRKEDESVKRTQPRPDDVSKLQQKKEEEEQAEIEAVCDELRKERERQKELRRQRHQWRRRARDSLEVLSADVDLALQREDARRSSEDAALKRFQKACTSAVAVKDQLQKACDWADAEHQRYVDLTGEVGAFRELSCNEHRETEEAVRQQTDEFSQLAERLLGVKATSQLLNGHLRALGCGGGDGGDADKEQLTQEFRRLAAKAGDGFRTLPASVKLLALAGDNVTMWLAAFAMIFGAILGVAISVEGFGAARCRLVCGSAAAALARGSVPAEL